MEFELWWLLALPVFFGMGWVAARVDLKSLLSESRALPTSYFRGLNFLLNEQPDKAIESFLQVAKENPQTVELQFALGSLFRRRGEVDRAIRMHQDLVNREDLPPESRRLASLELAEDYFKAGLLDHAEQVLARMAEADPSADVHRQLLDIYIQEKDWEKAIGAAQRLEASAKRNYQKEIANYYCELAITEHVHNRPEEAAAHLARALESNRKCVRANLVRGEWLAREGRHEDAIEAWKAIESQDPAYFGLAGEGMVESYKALGRLGEGLALLRGLQHRFPGLDLLNVVYQATAEHEGDEAAWRLVRDEVRRNPTLVGLDRLIDAELVRAPAERRQDLQLMKNLVHSHAQALAVYLCGNCGFKARQFFWQCPACGGWETFPPRRTAELEAPVATSRGCRLDNKRIIVALDAPDMDSALDLARRLDPRLCRVKVGKELFTAGGPAVVDALHQRGFDVFLDLKYHDIPNTVAGACRAAARLGVWMLNVHASGGEAMMRAAREAVAGAARPPLVIAVTILTSLADADLEQVGFAGSAADNAVRLARLARASGLDGVVCSAQEAARLREATGADFLLVTPGIRLEGETRGDQQRVVTPVDATRAGADYLVIGRPITAAADPVATLESIRQSLGESATA